MSDLIGCILIAIFGTMAWAFASLAVGKKKGDSAIIENLLKENEILKNKLAKYEDQDYYGK